MTDRLTLVSVVFEAEVRLLEVQARSFAKYLDPECCHSIFILDNSAFGLRAHTRRRLSSFYGNLADKVTYIRVKDMVTTRGADGWRSQQAAKLLIARRVPTAHYVVLDAKNHLIDPVAFSSFLARDGRAHTGFHSYRTHSLKDSLTRTMRYLGAEQGQIEAALDRFPVTATPFVFQTSLVTQMINWLEEASGRKFETTFEDEKLMEFFTYSGWVDLHGPGLATVMDGTAIQSPTVWPRDAHAEGVSQTFEHAQRVDAAFFGVHRQVFARAPVTVLRMVAAWWAEKGLYEDQEQALKLIMRARRTYRPAMALSRTHGKIQRLLRRTPV